MNLQKLTLVSTWEDTTKTVSLSYQHRKPECGWQYKITTCTLLFPGDSGIFEEVIHFGLTLPRKIPVRTLLPFLAVDCAVFEQQGVQHCSVCACAFCLTSTEMSSLVARLWLTAASEACSMSLMHLLIPSMEKSHSRCPGALSLQDRDPKLSMVARSRAFPKFTQGHLKKKIQKIRKAISHILHVGTQSTWS